jgi:hypothetical protein
MVVVQVQSQMASNYNVPGHSGFEKVLLYVAREVRPQCERRLAQQAFELESCVIHHHWTTLLKTDSCRGKSDLPPLFRVAVNKLAMNLSPDFVDNQYLKVLIVPQAVVAEVLCHLFAVLDRFGIRAELNADAVSVRNAVFHIEKELLHGQSSITWVAAVLYGVNGQPIPVPRERTHRTRYLPVLIADGPPRDRTRVLDDYAAQLVKLRHRVAFGFDGLAIGGGHDAHPVDQAGASGSLSPMNADGGAVMTLSWRGTAATRWSILLTSPKEINATEADIATAHRYAEASAQALARYDGQ